MVESTQAHGEPASSGPGLLRSVLLIVALIGGACGLAGLLYATRQDPPHRTAAAAAPFVETMLVRREDVVEHFVGYGTAKPDRSVNLSAEVAAKVIELVDDLEAGAVVAQSQPLIRLDDREYRIALERATALIATEAATIAELDAQGESLDKLIKAAELELRVARDEKARVIVLFEAGHAAKKECDFAHQAYQRARRVLEGYEMEQSVIAPRQARAVASKRSREAGARLAGLNIERCEIVTPFAGTIESLWVEVGDRASPGSMLVTLIDPSHVEIAIQLPAGVYDRTHLGAPCRVESESMPGGRWDGQVVRIAPSVDPQTRTFAAYVDVDNSRQEQSLVPGTFVRALIRGPSYHDRILLPRGAIRTLAHSPGPVGPTFQSVERQAGKPVPQGRGRVYVAVDGVARERIVTVERLIADRALVDGSIRAGDRVILSHLDRLSDGAPVRTRDQTLEATASPTRGGVPSGWAVQTQAP